MKTEFMMIKGKITSIATPACLLAAWMAAAMMPCTAAEEAKKPSRPEDPRQIALRNTLADESIRVVDELAFFGLLDLERPDLSAVREAVGKRDWPAAKAAWAKHVAEHLHGRWGWSYRDREKIKQFLGGHGVNLAQMAGAADRVMQRDFDQLGVHRKLERDIVWQSSEYEYEWCNVLNRHDYWKTLGYAWWGTGDPKYVEDWLFMLRD